MVPRVDILRIFAIFRETYLLRSYKKSESIFIYTKTRVYLFFKFSRSICKPNCQILTP